MKRVLLFAIWVLFCSIKSYSQCVPTCPGNVNVSLLPNDCKATLSAADFVSNISPACTYKLELQYPYGTQTYNPPVKLDASHQGYTFNYVVKDSVTNNPCWGKVHVNYCNPCLIPTPPVIDSFVVSPPPYIPGSTISLKLYATDDKSIQKVEFYNWYGDPIYTDNTYPYSYNYTFPAATATGNKFWAIVYDNCGSSDTSIQIAITTLFPACNDGVKNGTETNVDCGGSSCNACHNPGPIYPLPDLVLKNTSPVPNYVTSGQWIQLYGKVYNKGNASAPSTIVKAVLSTDANLSNNDYGLGTTNIPALAVNDSTPYSLHVAMPNWSYGSYYLVICVDPNYDITESTKLNNCVSYAVHFEEQHYYEPDLVTTYLDIDKNPIYEGDPFKVSYMTKNIGTANAGYSYSAIYLSNDRYFGYGDLKLAEHAVGSLSAGNNAVHSSTINQSISPGHYYILACADIKDQVSESIESNNCTYLDFYVHEHHASMTDLTTSYLAINKTNIYEGDAFKVSYMVNNISNVNAGSSYSAVYLSYNSYLDGGDLKIDESYVSSLNANSNIILESNVTRSIAPGHYYIIVCADSRDQLDEISEANNCSSIYLKVQALSSDWPDYTTSFLTTNKNPIASEEPFTVSFMINNKSNTNGSACNIGIYLSDDNEWNNSDRMLTQMKLPAIPADKSVFTEAGIFESFTPGNYHLIVCADIDGEVKEESELNNCFSMTVSITEKAAPKPDLVMETFNCKDTWNLGDTQLIQLRIRNIGYAKNEAGTANLILSDDILGTNPVSLGLIHFSSMNTNGFYDTTLAIILKDRFLEGQKYISACIDPLALISEANESNNCKSKAIQIQLPSIDFKNISAISYPNAINKNDTLRFPFSMTNIGTVTGKKVEVEYYLSFKAGLKGGSAIRLKIDTVDALLPAGDTLNKKVNLTFPASASGGYYLNICIDYNNKVEEKSEINNCQAMRIYLAAPVSPSTSEFTGSNTLEIRGRMKLNDISVFPNPASDHISIRGMESQDGIKELKITDLSGKIIIRSKYNSARMDISHLNKGVYILQISNERESKVIKLIKE